MAKQISSCHNKPVVRGKTHGRPVCSQCGAFCGYPKKLKKPDISPTLLKAQQQWLDDGKTSFDTTPDTRDMIRHLSHPEKFAVCRRRGFRTTDLSRVNCKLCLQSEFYRERLKQKQLISLKN